MAHNSSLVTRFGAARNLSPVLPIHTHDQTEYDLHELSPRSEESHMFSAASEAAFVASEMRPAPTRAPAVSFAYQDQPRATSHRRQSKHSDYDEYDTYQDNENIPDSRASRTKQPMFAGPPPPIARSMVMNRDVEDCPGSILEHGQNNTFGASSFRLPTNTVVLDPKSTHASARAPRGSFDSESTWAVLQRRERALQTEIQNYLNIQSAGLAAGLGRGPPSDGGYGGSDDSYQRSSRSNTPTADSFNKGGRSVRLPTERATASGAIIPVRQPRPRKLGIRAARAGLSRGISLFASLKADEDAVLESALHVRKRALAHLNQLSGRKTKIAQELHALETDDEEPLTRELATLQSAHKSTSEQIAELEARLAMLRQRQRTLEGRIRDATSQRESGLSGYRGALKEVDAQLTTVLRRPPIRPLDVEALGGGKTAARLGDPGLDEGRIRLDDHDGAAAAAAAAAAGRGGNDASAGIDFLRLLPERRTEEMARFWWETEVRLLEWRRTEVAAEREALEEGGAMWLEAAQLVADFEANLRKDMTADGDGDGSDNNGKGKDKEPTPEEKMRNQLANMAAVIAGLRHHLQVAESKGWNLLICAIGAELEAFREARTMLRQSLRAAGLYVDDDDDDDDTEDEDADLETASKAAMSEKREKLARSHNGNGNNNNNNNNDDGAADSPDNGILLDGLGKSTPGLATVAAADDEDNSTTPRLARSTSDALSSLYPNNVNDHEHSRHHHYQRNASESDDSNDVPPDLFAAHEPAEYDDHDGHADSSDNEVPADFLAHHDGEA